MKQKKNEQKKCISFDQSWSISTNQIYMLGGRVVRPLKKKIARVFLKYMYFEIHIPMTFIILLIYLFIYLFIYEFYLLYSVFTIQGIYIPLC